MGREHLRRRNGRVIPEQIRVQGWRLQSNNLWYVPEAEFIAVISELRNVNPTLININKNNFVNHASIGIRLKHWRDPLLLLSKFFKYSRFWPTRTAGRCFRVYSREKVVCHCLFPEEIWNGQSLPQLLWIIYERCHCFTSQHLCYESVFNIPRTKHLLRITIWQSVPRHRGSTMTGANRPQSSSLQSDGNQLPD